MRPTTLLLGFMGLAVSFVAQAEDPSVTVVRDAQVLANCTIALDAACVIGLSNVAAYERLAAHSSPIAFDFAKAQTRFFDGMKRNGWSYTQFEVSSDPEVFASGGRLYAFIGYVSAMEVRGRRSGAVHAYFVGVSSDKGRSWKFLDGYSLTSQTAHLIVEGYRGSPPLPPVDSR